ncbi:MAG TPA: hypothetical protein VMF13_19610 [Luteitalea sp.]|nr:hypothetical protein [Luteitalea sp.]
MMTRTCSHEDAVVAAALAGHELDAPLEAHVAGCANCREVHALVSVLHDDRADTLAQAQVPSAGLVWWKATLRARHEDAARATRPITVVAAVTAAAVAGLLVSVAGLLAWWMQDALAAQPIVQALAAAMSTSDPSGAVSGVRLAVWLVAGALLVATPLLLYVALRDE